MAVAVDSYAGLCLHDRADTAILYLTNLASGNPAPAARTDRRSNETGSQNRWLARALQCPVLAALNRRTNIRSFRACTLGDHDDLHQGGRDPPAAGAKPAGRAHRKAAPAAGRRAPAGQCPSGAVDLPAISAILIAGKALPAGPASRSAQQPHRAPGMKTRVPTPWPLPRR